jgi:hypothetical protein
MNETELHSALVIIGVVVGYFVRIVVERRRV